MNSSSSSSKTAVSVGLIVGVLALAALAIALIVALKKPKPAPAPSPAGPPLTPTAGTSTAITLPGGGFYAAGPSRVVPKPAIAPSVAAGCGCSPGVGYGDRFTDIHSLEVIGPMVQKGCKRADAANFDPADHTVPTNDGCQEKIFGCTDERAWNYMPWANTAYPGACWYPAKKHGCTDKNAFNYDPTAEIDNGSCIPRVSGCTSLYAANYNPYANTDDGSCVPFKLGCTNPSSTNYDPDATVDSGECVSPGKAGCTVLGYDNYDRFARFNDGSCCGKRDGMLQCGNPFSKSEPDVVTQKEAGDCSFCA